LSVKLYMDEHVPRAIIVALRAREIDVLTAQEDDMDGSPDDELLARAHLLQRAIFTRDTDFLREASRLQESAIAFSGVIFASQLGVSIGQCIADLELLASAADASELANRVEYLPLR
jgi:hypothetical protein